MNDLYASYLKHHGILGMKWGRKMGPPYPLDAGDHSASEKKAGWRKSLDGGADNSDPKRKATSSSSAKAQNKPGKGENKLSKIGKEKLDKHRKKLEASYQKNGMSKQDAEEAAKRRIRAEKIIAGVALVTVAAAVAYVAHDKYAKEFVGQTLKAGTKFHTITGNENKSMDKTFYAAHKTKDRIIYKGLYGNQIARNPFNSANGVFDVTTKATKAMKVPSRRDAAKVFSDLYKSDPDFKRAFESNVSTFNAQIGLGDKQRRVFKTASKAMSDKELLKEGYDAFNIGLVNHSPGAASANQKFYDKLKSLGYNAVLDVNDSKYSGFKANAPVIVFDTESVVKESVKKLTESQLQKNEIAQDLIRNGASYVTSLGLMVGGGVAYAKALDDLNKVAGVQQQGQKQNQRRVVQQTRKRAKKS